MQFMKVDERLCSGCKICAMICSLKKFNENNFRKAAIRIEGKFPKPGRYTIHVCTQCGECALACPNNAIEEKINGIWVVNSELCNGCGICVDICQQKAIFIPEDEDFPVKCDFCKECIPYCPRGILASGEQFEFFE